MDFVVHSTSILPSFHYNRFRIRPLSTSLCRPVESLFLLLLLLTLWSMYSSIQLCILPCMERMWSNQHCSHVDAPAQANGYEFWICEWFENPSSMKEEEEGSHGDLPAELLEDCGENDMLPNRIRDRVDQSVRSSGSISLLRQTLSPNLNVKAFSLAFIYYNLIRCAPITFWIAFSYLPPTLHPFECILLWIFL